MRFSECPGEEKGYVLVWADEFHKDGIPDSTKWNYERGFVRNEELQWYQAENAYCKNGMLMIEARRTSRSMLITIPERRLAEKQEAD